MSQQLRLFETGAERWIADLWKKVDPDRRQEVVTILAEMAGGMLGTQETPGNKGEHDASR